MLTIINARDIEGRPFQCTVSHATTGVLDATGLTVLPALIDPHVHFRTPGFPQKEDWCTGAQAAIQGGYTTVMDMPNTFPTTVTADRIREKKALIDAQLVSINIPLRYGLYLGADAEHFDQWPLVKSEIVAVKIFMGSSTGGLLLSDQKDLEQAFELAKQYGYLIAVHAEDDDLIHARTEQYAQQANSDDYAIHSIIRDPSVAKSAVIRAIDLAERHQVPLYILHVSSSAELEVIRAAKARGVLVYAEATPHHLFLNTEDYTTLKGCAKVNPPLRHIDDQIALCQALVDGTIDVIGSDHAPHTLDEKHTPYLACPCGMPGIETTLPLLLNAHHLGQLSLNDIVRLTHDHAQKLFSLPQTNDWVLVDLNHTQTVSTEHLKTKCAWSAFEGRTLTGWPIWTILRDRIYPAAGYSPQHEKRLDGLSGEFKAHSYSCL